MLRKPYCDKDGYATAISLVAILSGCIVLCAAANLVSSTSKKEQAYGRYLERNERCEKLIDEFMEDFQKIKDDKNDSPSSENMTELLRKYGEYEIVIRDVSTGVNKEIVSKEFLMDRHISRLLDLDGERYESHYGWINPRLGDKNRIREILKDHGKKDTADVFPHFSYMPLYNIFCMDDEFVRAVLEYCKTENTEEKTRKIRELRNGNRIITQEMLSEELSLPSSHAVFDFLGVKTTFWKVDLKVQDAKASLVIAAVPKRFENRREAECYRVVERRYET